MVPVSGFRVFLVKLKAKHTIHTGKVREGGENSDRPAAYHRVFCITGRIEDGVFRTLFNELMKNVT